MLLFVVDFFAVMFFEYVDHDCHLSQWKKHVCISITVFVLCLLSLNASKHYTSSNYVKSLLDVVSIQSEKKHIENESKNVRTGEMSKKYMKRMKRNWKKQKPKKKKKEKTEK